MVVIGEGGKVVGQSHPCRKGMVFKCRLTGAWACCWMWGPNAWEGKYHYGLKSFQEALATLKAGWESVWQWQ